MPAVPTTMNNSLIVDFLCDCMAATIRRPPRYSPITDLLLFEVLFGIRAVPILENIHEPRNGFVPSPVALKFTIELSFADELSACLFHTTQRGLMRRYRGSADSVRDNIHLIAFLQGVQRREGTLLSRARS